MAKLTSCAATRIGHSLDSERCDVMTIRPTPGELPVPGGSFAAALTGTAYGWMSSSSSVTSAAMGERSDRVKVMCAKSGCPFSFSTTATTPS